MQLEKINNMADTLKRETTTDGAEHANGIEHSTTTVVTQLSTPSQPATSRFADESDITLLPPKRNRLRVAVPVLLIVALAIGTTYFFFRPVQGPPTAAVRRGTIVSTVETTGKLEAQTKAKLSFKAAGQVSKVIAKQGDNVKVGDVLAELDTEDLQRKLDEAKTQLDISKLKLQQAKEGAQPADIAAATADLNGAIANLNDTRAGGRAEDIAAAQAQLNQAQAKLDAVKKGATTQDIAQAEAAVREAQAKLETARRPGTPQQIAEAQAAVDQAQANLDKVNAPATAQDLASAQSKLDQAKANREQAAITASNAKEQARIAQDQAANLVANAQDAYAKIRDDNAKVKGRDVTDDEKQAEERARRDMQDAQGKLAQARNNYDTAKLNEVAQVNAADAQVKEAQAALDKLKVGATIQDVRAAQAQLDQAKAKLNALKAGGTASEIAAAQAGVDQAQEALNKLRAGPTAEDVRQAQAGVDQAKADLDKVKKGATAQEIAAAQAKVDAAKAALDKVKAGPTATDVQILEQQINVAQISVDTAAAQIADAKLTSPIAGTVLSIDLDVGVLVTGQQPVAEVADTSSLRVKGDIDEIDVGRVQAGQPVTVTLDAYPGEKMQGKIEALAPGATLKQGSTVYQATISFTPTQGVVPREGMAANVDVTAQRKDNVLMLPNRAFETVGRKEYVTVSESGSTRKVEVETGLTNATDTEVISGLDEGQVVRLK